MDRERQRRSRLLTRGLWRGLLILLAACLGRSYAVAGPAARKVIVGINRDYPPYEYLDGRGQPAGYDVDLLRAIGKLEDLDLEFRTDSWDSTLQAFRDGRVDLLPGLLYSKEREAFADFSAPHLVVHYTLFVREGGPAIQGLSGIPGHTVLVERQSQMHEYLRGLGLEASLRPVASEPEALRRLAIGEADAAVAPQLEGLLLAQQAHLPIQSVGGSLLARQLCFATRKGDADLLGRLNTGLAILNQTGAYAPIYQHWFGNLQPDLHRAQVWTRRIAVALGALFVALLLVAAWNWSLRRQVTHSVRSLREANRRIRERQAFLDAVVENLPVAVFGKDPQQGFAFTLWNTRAEQVFGLRKADVMGKTDADFFPPEQAEAFRAKDEEVIRSRTAVEVPQEPIRSHALGDIQLHTLKVPLFDETGRPTLLLGISENITDRLAMEEALRQAQKLESLGILAGGIAHDFNNLLTAILGNLGLAELTVPVDHPVLPFLANAQATAHRAADLTRQMLAYSGKGILMRQPLDLSLAAEEMASLLRVSISKKVALRFAFPANLPRIEADQAQVQQVVMNLVTNASEAYGDREGEILVATGTETLDAAAALHPATPVPPGHYVTLRVEDHGCGMAPEVLSRIFDPFFTTKFSGRGLGMSAMLGILRAHGAGLSVRSRPSEGTEFRLYFPAVEMDGADDTSPAARRPFTAERRTILVVEDEQDVRQTVAAQLRQAGFDVLEAGDGVEGCEAYRPRIGQVQAVIMDLTMPRMDGRAAALEIQAMDPMARIILTSGFPSELETREGRPAPPFAAFLQKPYHRDDLLAALQEAIEPEG